MTLTYKFKKEKLDSGEYVARPKIFVAITGEKSSVEVAALIDSGCDTTVIPEGIATVVGLDMSGKKDKMFAYRESSDIIRSKANITFLGRAKRQEVTLNNVPVLIALTKEGFKDEEDITLGVGGIFDAFEITFKKLKNKITFKKVIQLPTS